MPIFDYACNACGQLFERLTSYAERDNVRCGCGGSTERIYVGRAPNMIPDSIPGGVVLENLTPQPKRYFSRTEIRDQMRVLNVQEKVQHVGEQGSDRSKHTTRWI